MLTTTRTPTQVGRPSGSFHENQRRLVEASLLHRPVRSAARWDDRLRVAYLDPKAA
jgi:hypothetical protein